MNYFIVLVPSLFCSHRKAVDVYIDAKYNPSKYRAVSAKSCSDFKNHHVNASYVVNMGINCPTR